MKALILGAGYATGLYPLTKDRPKSLLPLAGRPLVEHLLSSLANVKELDRVYLVTNHRFVDRYRDWLENYQAPKRVELLDDGTTTQEDRLGAVGDMQFAIERARVHDDLLVMAGDILVRFDLPAFVAFFKQRGATIALKEMDSPEAARRFGAVQLDADNRVVEFEEKPAAPRGALISIGLYALPRTILPKVKEYLTAGHNPEAPGYFIEWLHRQTGIYGYTVREPWFDIGDIDSYNQANELLEQGANG